MTGKSQSYTNDRIHPVGAAILMLVLCSIMPLAVSDDFARSRDALRQSRAAVKNSLSSTPEMSVKLKNTARKQAEEAVRLFREKNINNSDDMTLLREYAEALRAAGSADLAAEVLESLLEKYPNDTNLMLDLGQSLAPCGREKRREAYLYLNCAAQTADRETAAAAWKQLAGMYLDDALYTFAREAVNKARAIQPEDTLTAIYDAVIKVTEGKISEASATIDNLGRDALPYDARTRILLRSATAACEEKRMPFEDTAANNRAWALILYRAARFLDAIMAAQRTVQLAPDDWETLTFLGQVLSQAGNIPGAINVWEKSLAVNPDQQNLANTLHALKEQQKKAARPSQ